MQGFPLPGFGVSPSALLRFCRGFLPGLAAFPPFPFYLVSPGSPGHSVRARLGLAGSLLRAAAVGGGPSSCLAVPDGLAVRRWPLEGQRRRLRDHLIAKASVWHCRVDASGWWCLAGAGLASVAASGGAFWSCRLGQDHAQLASMILAGSLALPGIWRGLLPLLCFKASRFL